MEIQPKSDGRRFPLSSVLCIGAAAMLLVAWFSGFILGSS